MNNQPGGAADVVRRFSAAGVGIAYMYAFVLNGQGILIFRTAETAKAEEVIVGEGLQALSEQDLPLHL